MPRLLSPLAAAALVLSLALAAPGQWHHPLYLAGGGWWDARARVVVSNDTDLPLVGAPLSIKVGDEPGQLAIVGQSGQAIRVVKADGTEVLYAIYGSEGTKFEGGPVPSGSALVFPAECPARGQALYFVYYDNPAAGWLPDFLTARTELANGDLEEGGGDAPSGWQHDEADAAHSASWVSESPESGRRCLKTVVDAGAELTWISTRQRGLHISGGAKYRMTAWVKAEDVAGEAGWYIHLGNEKEPMLASPMLIAGEGTFDWKEVSSEFTAPDAANLADLGTVLRGTGTAWFDNVRLERIEPGKASAAALAPEELRLKAEGGDATWHEDPAQDAVRWDHRAVVRAFNFTSQPATGALVAVDLRMLDNRLRGRLNREAIVASFAGKPAPCLVQGDSLLIEAELPARTVRALTVYLTDDPLARAPAGDKYAELIASPRNLAANGSFEQGAEQPEAWTASGAGDTDGGAKYDLAAPGKLGDRSAHLRVPADAPKTWRGWRQAVKVRPGATYLYAAWVKCREASGEVRLHAHERTAEGKMSAAGGYTSVGEGLKGTTDWTLLAGTLTMPPDTVELDLHLTTDATGEFWHDGVLLAEVTPGTLAAFEGRPMGKDALEVWQVPAVEKVFPDTPVPQQAAVVEIAAARGEAEPLQLAVRSGRAVRDVQIEVDVPAGPAGAKLDDFTVNVVGYVPIDYPTNYYSSELPAWVRKVPTARPGCDGWPGWWPDPLLPRRTLDLVPNATRSLWVTFRVARDAPAGLYAGKVRLTAAGKTLAEVPFDLRVWDFALPEESHLAAIYDVRLGSDERWGKSLDEMYPRMVDFMAANRLSPDTIRPAPTFRRQNGRVTADFTAYDEAAARYFDTLKLPYAYAPQEFYLFGWGHPPKTIFGERPYAGDRAELRPEYKQVYQEMLKLYWEHLKEKGWDKKVVLYISDEPYDHHQHIRTQMKALCQMIHEVDRAIPIYSSTWHHVPDWDGSLDVWGIGHDGRVPLEKMAEIRNSGARIWFTTDGQMCTDTPYCAVERLLPHYAFKCGAEAYEFWGVAWLTYDPYRYGWHAYIHQSGEPGEARWVRYPNGDGFLLYPGAAMKQEAPVSSIRFEQAREGVEDYEYLTLLRERISAAKAAGRDTAKAEAAMEAAAALVEVPNAGGRYSSKILPEPAKLYEVRARLAEAIEERRD